MTATASPDINAELIGYGSKLVAVEPGGAEFIPLDARHGSPLQLLWTWTSPNMEFATVGVGILGPLAFGMSFWDTFLAIVLGTAVGAGTQGLLSMWGPRAGLPQMVISRSAFGFLGNILPAGLNALIAGIGWFAVNSISGALAMHTLVDGIPKGLCLLIVVVTELVLAFCGHNLVQAAERFAFPVLFAIFVIASVWVLTKAHPGAASQPIPGAFLIMVGATFGYAAGWNPYAADYTRYLAPDTRPVSVGFWAGLGVFWSCTLLETAGAAVVTAGQKAVDPSSFTNLVPTWLGKLTLIAIVIGAICANAINMYSGSLSFMAMGVRLPTRAARAAVAVGLGVVGTLLAFKYLNNTGAYENFLLVIAYWVGPWLGVVFVDRLLRRGTDSSRLYGDTRHVNLAGPIAMLVAGVLSIWLFSDQTKYVAPIPKAHPSIGDLTFEVGFVVAAALYLVLHRVLRSTSSAPVPERTNAFTKA
ncbi:purine-cytosine permease family protein [uncultured Jatrophihabitans sp.]|uniref:purine-cytosine permease family protein n=1 Tax=uncultured Jatrophihabitans sp. TaxID=1610747 RepID=UPI0035CACF58